MEKAIKKSVRGRFFYSIVSFSVSESDRILERQSCVKVISVIEYVSRRCL